jgi:hypothetical protein
MVWCVDPSIHVLAASLTMLTVPQTTPNNSAPTIILSVPCAQILELCRARVVAGKQEQGLNPARPGLPYESLPESKNIDDYPVRPGLLRIVHVKSCCRKAHKIFGPKSVIFGWHDATIVLHWANFLC